MKRTGFRVNKCPLSYLYKYKKQIIIMLIFFTVTIILLGLSNRLIIRDIFKELGNKVMVIAVTISQGIKIDPVEYERLMSLDFHQLLKDPVNMEFEKMTRSIMEYTDIKYIYLISTIPNQRVKYQVDVREEVKYGSPLGTPLNVIYLLDAVADDHIRFEDTRGMGYVDKDRYTVIEPAYKKVLESRKPMYYISEDQWGKYITGYAPCYDDTGKLIGIVGVDLCFDTYIKYVNRNMQIISALFLVFVGIGLFSMKLIYKIKVAEDRIEQKTLLSNTDFLTGLMNRRRFIQELYQGWKQSFFHNLPMALLIIDIDYFKEYNDNYGHLLGDKLLHDVAMMLLKGVKRSTDFVGRYGGDEFVVILHNTDNIGALKVGKRIQENIKSLEIKHECSKISHSITVSIGAVSMVANEEMNPYELLKYADKALYEAKRSGRNCIKLWDESLSC